MTSSACLRIPGIVRNRLKVESTVNNAKRVLELESLDDYLWGFVDGEPIVNRGESSPTSRPRRPSRAR